MSPLLSLLLVLAVQDGKDPVAAAHMQAEPLSVGQSLEFVVRFERGRELWYGDPADVGVPRPILQVDAPDCVVLQGEPPKEWVTPHDFETNYLRFPYGRKLSAKESKVVFELTREPRPGEVLGLNLVYWLGKGPEVRFVRQRLELPLVSDAQAKPGDAQKTAWGKHDTLAVGDRADAFTLPSQDGIEVALEDFEGAAFLLFTYRAHW